MTAGGPVQNFPLEPDLAGAAAVQIKRRLHAQVYKKLLQRLQEKSLGIALWRPSNTTIT